MRLAITRQNGKRAAGRLSLQRFQFMRWICRETVLSRLWQLLAAGIGRNFRHAKLAAQSREAHIRMVHQRTAPSWNDGCHVGFRPQSKQNERRIPEWSYHQRFAGSV